MITIKSGQIWELSSGDIAYTLVRLPSFDELEYFAGQYFQNWLVLILDKKSSWMPDVGAMAIYPDSKKFQCNLLCSS